MSVVVERYWTEWDEQVVPRPKPGPVIVVESRYWTEWDEQRSKGPHRTRAVGGPMMAASMLIALVATVSNVPLVLAEDLTSPLVYLSGHVESTVLAIAVVMWAIDKKSKKRLTALSPRQRLARRRESYLANPVYVKKPRQPLPSIQEHISEDLT